MLAASAVDEMLRHLGFEGSSLFLRIGAAQAAGRMTNEMVAWAHQVRLDANDQRHPKGGSLPSVSDAQHSVDFAMALAEYLYALPARVTRGLSATPAHATESK